MNVGFRNILTIASILIALCFSASADAENYPAAYVYDGDTILLQNGTRVRYIGINAPEIDHENGNDEPFAQEAKDLNRELIKGKNITLEYDRQTRDRYKRTLAYVFIENGEMANALMVKNGLAYVESHKPNMRYRAYLIHVQRQAMQERAGIWKNLSMEEKTPFRGNRKSFRFHRNDCPSGKQIPINNRIAFSSMHQAFWEGYSPCRRCLPKWYERSSTPHFHPETGTQGRKESMVIGE